MDKKQEEAGYFLLEFVVSLLLISIMLLGFDALQLLNVQQSQIITAASIANRQLMVMAEKLILFKDQDHAVLMANWDQENKMLLPNGQGNVVGYYSHYVISLSWGVKNTSCTHNHFENKSGCLILRI